MAALVVAAWLPGWVRVQQLPGGLIEVQAGPREQRSVQFAIRESSGWWESFTGAAQTYQCQEGGLTLWGGFQPPPVENPSGDTRGASAKCTFSKAADGSLVMLEEPYVGVPRGTMAFKKWWRWRQIAQPERATRPPPPEGFRDPWPASMAPRISPHGSNPMKETNPGSAQGARAPASPQGSRDDDFRPIPGSPDTFVSWGNLSSRNTLRRIQ